VLACFRQRFSWRVQVSFILPAVGAMAYYAMWTGLGVEFKTTDTSPRVIFWARYIDYVITVPVSPYAQERVCQLVLAHGCASAAVMPRT
jgi:bacteriorhodopsin